ncbi:MAG: immunoglobulin domain-containing protein [Verrucomicrobiae bacterium]|nr:immunoglobulin domain-containing protein [Verrucomicrobiae bacterium]
MASLFLLALMLCVSSAPAALVITGDTVSNASGAVPPWTVATNSLIAGMLPSASDTPGNFQQSYGPYGTIIGLPALTDGVLPGCGATYGGSAQYATCGYDHGGGQWLIYTLPAAAHGYDITNITTFTTWGDQAVCGEAYAVSYSTADNPTAFIFLGNVYYQPNGSGGMANRVQCTDSLGGTIAPNAAAIKLDFLMPTSALGVNAYTEITVQGTPAAAVTAVAMTSSNIDQAGTFDPSSTWPVESPSLIAGMLPSASTGNPALGGGAGGGGFPVLTDGALGLTGDSTTVASLGSGSSGPCSSLTYTLTNSANGSDLTNIVVYTAWGDYGRDGQAYSISYSTVSAPTTFIRLTGADFNPVLAANNDSSACRVSFSPSTGVLAHNVYRVKFDFPQPDSLDYGAGSYQEIIIQGTNSLPPPVPPSPYLVQDTVPVYAQTVVGDQVVFTAVYSNSPPANQQWLFISGGVTNIISGATGPTLTLNNVQLTNSGSYTLKAVNATNGAAAPSYSTLATLTVATNGLVPVRNILTTVSSQTSDGTGFVPSWPLATNSLLAGLATTTEVGDFTQSGASSGTAVLTDGIIGPVSADPGWESLFTTAGLNWNGTGGQSLIYTLPANAYGYNLTNITVFSGWENNTRDAQSYNVSYATADNPTSFISLGTVEINPSMLNYPTANRVMLTAATGTVIAPNVAALRFDFSAPFVENGYAGYMEITAQGPAATTVTAPPLLIMTDTQPNLPAATAPTWTIETNSLIAGRLPSSVGPGSFTADGMVGGPANLTDGTFGSADAKSSYASCGYGEYSPGQTAIQSLTYTLTNATLTNIVVYSGWTDFGRQGQFYDVYYSTISAPTTFVLLTSIWLNSPFVFGGANAHRVDISTSTGAALATNVAAVKFDFAPQSDANIDYGFSGYAELVLQGTNQPGAVVPVLPTLSNPAVSGGSLILKGTGGTPAGYSYTWLTATNLTTPLTNWTVSVSGTLDGAGNLSNAIPINVTNPASFFKLRMP